MIILTRTLPSSSPKRFAIAVLACGALSLAAAAAQAGGPQPDGPQVRVSYADLDLNTDRDTLRLYRRISAAAHEVCPSEGSVVRKRNEFARACVEQAISQAVQKVGSARLAEVQASFGHRSKMG